MRATAVSPFEPLLFTAQTVITSAVLAVVAALMGFTAVRFRDIKGGAPARHGRAHALEAAVFLALLAFTAWLAVFTASVHSRAAARPRQRTAARAEWTAHMPGACEATAPETAGLPAAGDCAAPI